MQVFTNGQETTKQDYLHLTFLFSVNEMINELTSCFEDTKVIMIKTIHSNLTSVENKVHCGSFLFNLY